jgi:hypothetical protein
MHWLRAAGVAVTGAGIAGYVVGTAVPYPGRAFSITGLIVGITLLSITTGQEVAA